MVVQASRRFHKRSLLSAPPANNAGNQSGDEFRDHQGYHQPSPPTFQALEQSHAVLDALSDENSQLARFLFIRNKDGQVEASIDDGGNINNINGRNDEEDEMPSMGDLAVAFLSLSLEPVQVRNERITQIFEAYAIFGALFMNGVWIIYEWGSPKGYGGDGINDIVGRVFECVMALALCINSFFALFSAVCWILSLFWSTSHEDFAFLAGKPLVYLTSLIAFIPGFIIIGVLLGIYSNLSPYWPETIVTLFLVAIVVLVGQRRNTEFQLECAPLECYHTPNWFKNIMFPQILHSSKEISKVKAGAKLRANMLRKRAYSQRKQIAPGIQATDSNDYGSNASSMAALLCKAAANLDRPNTDISIYMACLEEDWITKPKQLKDVSIGFLTQYMPFGLAREVHQLLEQESREEDLQKN